jgi:hypothetical protein
MAAAVPVVVPVAVHQPQIGLVHQRRRIQRLAGPFLRDLLRCQPPQLVVDQWLLPTEGRRSRGCRLYSTKQTAKRRNPVSAPIRRGAGSPSPPKATARPHVLRRRPQSGTVRPGAGDPEGGRLNRGFSQKRLCFTHSAPRTYRSSGATHGSACLRKSNAFARPRKARGRGTRNDLREWSAIRSRRDSIPCAISQLKPCC